MNKEVKFGLKAGRFKKVESSNLLDVKYDARLLVLSIRFLNRPNWTYRYVDVTPNVYEDLMKAPSVGEFFHSNIKDTYNFYKDEFNK